MHNEEQLLNECDKEGEQFMLEDEVSLKTSHEKVNVASMKPENPSQIWNLLINSNTLNH